MLFKYNINNYTLNEYGVTVDLKTEKITILFQEIESVYVRLYKMKLKLILILVLSFSLLVVFLSYLVFLPLDWIQVIFLVSIIFISIKISNYRRFKLIIRLKNGTLFTIDVPTKSKHDAILVVQYIRKKITIRSNSETEGFLLQT